jgi:hypothetical protein
MTDRLTEAELLRALYWQRKGLTMTEIAIRLETGRERIVASLYWDRVSTQQVAA